MIWGHQHVCYVCISVRHVAKLVSRESLTPCKAGDTKLNLVSPVQGD